MSYNSKIKQLEVQYESLSLKIKNPLPHNDINSIESKRLVILDELRKLRRLQYESQFVMNDDYEY